MFDIAGRYEYYKSENCDAFFKTTVPEAKSIANLQAQIDIVQHGKSGVYELTHTLPNKTIQTVFKLGVPFLDEVPTGNVFQSVATLDGNILRIKSTFNGEDYGGRDLEFSKEGLTVTILVPHFTPLKAVRYYKRLI
ncbi:uncharacterized protein [Atheta coriaria]|uniref:uncharacterized protein n=1 Tax=Dalotia coriaria TaxID=877792 RepID=UPI0031F3D93F